MINKASRSLLRLRIIFIFTTLFLVALSIYGYFQTIQMIDSYKWLIHTNKVNLSLKKISIKFNDALSIQRGYLLTGDSTPLKYIDSDYKTISHELNLIGSLIKDNPEQIKNLKMLRKAINEKLTDFKLEKLKPLQVESELRLLRIYGFYEARKINELTSRMSLLEEKLFEIRSQKHSRKIFITPLFIIILFLGALFILWISYSELNFELNHSQKLKIEIDESHQELERINKKLINEVEQFLKIFDNNPIAMSFAEIGSNRIIYANNLFYTSFGYTKEEVIGNTTEELNLISSEENKRLIPIILNLLQEQRSIEELRALPAEETAEVLLKLKQKMFENGYEILYTRKNGETFLAIVFYEIILLGNKKYTLASYLDITERKEMELQLAEQKAFAELVIENDPAMILAIDKNFNVIAWNKKSEEHANLKKEEVIGNNLFHLFPEYNNEQWVSLYNSVLNEGKSLHFPILEFKRKKGFGENWVLPLRNAKQQIIGLLSITLDITAATEITRTLEQKNIELEKINKKLIQTSATLETSEERYQRMITEVKDYAILFLSKEGIIENWNEGAEKIKGYKSDEIIGKNFNLFYTDQDRQSQLPEKLLSDAKLYGTALHEGWRVRKNGSKFWGSIVITALYDSKNNIIGFSKVTRDLTDKKVADDKILEANKALEQKNIELQKTNKELESINYISSHDLQEPLRQIQIFASRISDIEQQNLSDAGKTYFQKMNNAAKRMQNLIADLLAYSRTKTEARKFKTINLNQIINEVTDEFAEIISEKHAILEVAELGDANIIPFQFRQMMYNLIGNALKFSKPNTPPHIIIKNEKVKSIQVSGADPLAETEYYHISITDNGIGFEPQYKERIFGVLQRLHDKQKIAGTGIGLAIVKNIIENHNGIITATGELNKGATFDIYIPTIQNNKLYDTLY